MALEGKALLEFNREKLARVQREAQNELKRNPGAARKFHALVRDGALCSATPCGVGDYIARWQTARALSTPAGYAEARTRLEAKRAELAAALQLTFNASRFDEAAQRALTAGAELALAGATAGLAAGPIGAVVGGAAGFVAGLVAGIWPTEKQIALDTWRAIVAGLSPVERYLMLPMLRSLSDESMVRQARAPWPAWRLGDEGIPFGHTLLEGEDVTVLFALEILLESNAFISDEDPKARAYCAAVLACYHENGTKLEAARHIRGLADSGKLGALATRIFNSNRAVTCGSLREMAVTMGMADITAQPETMALNAALEAQMAVYNGI